MPDNEETELAEGPNLAQLANTIAIFFNRTMPEGMTYTVKVVHERLCIDVHTTETYEV